MRWLHLSITFLTVILVLLGAIGLYGVQFVSRPGPLAKDQLVEVKQGWGVNRLAHQLEQDNIIEQAWAFQIAARLTGRLESLKAGEFMLPAHSSILDLLDVFNNAQPFHRRITFPEGDTSYQIVQTLNKSDFFSSAPITEIPAEGILLPETYYFTKAEGRKDIIARMQEAQQKHLDYHWENRAANLPLDDKYQALILASIIEKETGIAGERKRIAGVFVNRLNKGMLLQTDPTVIYALTKGRHKDDGQGPLGRRLYRKDLKVDSPYNTYRFKGLPPTPIANAGKASIEAALNPETHSYLYFVADGTGGHVFSKTLEEHNRNAAKWRRIRDGQR